jgi:Fe2+ transport system protein FeoA
MDNISLNKGLHNIRYRVIGLNEGEGCIHSCNPCLNLRLLEFGILIGEEITIKRVGDPMIIRVNDSWDMGIREEEAQRIQIQKTK